MFPIRNCKQLQGRSIKFPEQNKEELNLIANHLRVKLLIDTTGMPFVQPLIVPLGITRNRSELHPNAQGEIIDPLNRNLRYTLAQCNIDPLTLALNDDPFTEFLDPLSNEPINEAMILCNARGQFIKPLIIYDKDVWESRRGECITGLPEDTLALPLVTVNKLLRVRRQLIDQLKIPDANPAKEDMPIAERLKAARQNLTRHKFTSAGHHLEAILQTKPSSVEEANTILEAALVLIAIYKASDDKDKVRAIAQRIDTRINSYEKDCDPTSLIQLRLHYALSHLPDKAELSVSVFRNIIKLVTQRNLLYSDELSPFKKAQLHNTYITACIALCETEKSIPRIYKQYQQDLNELLEKKAIALDYVATLVRDIPVKEAALIQAMAHLAEAKILNLTEKPAEAFTAIARGWALIEDYTDSFSSNLEYVIDLNGFVEQLINTSVIIINQLGIQYEPVMCLVMPHTLEDFANSIALQDTKKLGDHWAQQPKSQAPLDKAKQSSTECLQFALRINRRLLEINPSQTLLLANSVYLHYLLGDFKRAADAASFLMPTENESIRKIAIFAAIRAHNIEMANTLLLDSHSQKLFFGEQSSRHEEELRLCIKAAGINPQIIPAALPAKGARPFFKATETDPVSSKSRRMPGPASGPSE